MVFVPLENCPCALCSNNIATVVPHENFDAAADAKALREAMRGLGCNNEVIREIMPARTANQRVEIGNSYKNVYGRDLIDDLKSELGGNFERLVIAMMHPWPQLGARAIKMACKGLGTNEQTLIDVLCTANNCEVRTISKAFHAMYESSVEDILKKELSGDFLHLMVAIARGMRNEESPLNPEQAKEDARALYEAGELKYGTDESTFTRVLVQNSYKQLHAVSQAYQKMTGKTLEEVCEAELGGDLLKAARTIFEVSKDKWEFWARRLHSCMDGLGTDDIALINIIVARSEIDLGNIKQEFRKIYEKTLEDWIEDECSGDYKKMLLAVLAEAKSS